MAEIAAISDNKQRRIPITTKQARKLKKKKKNQKKKDQMWLTACKRALSVSDN